MSTSKRKYSVVNIETGEIAGDKTFDNIGHAKLSAKQRINPEKFGAAEIKSVIVGPISRYNKDKKKWEDVR